MAGYSGKSLAQKLSLKPGWNLAVIDPPPHYWDLLSPLPDDLVLQPLQAGSLDCVHVFVIAQAALAAQIEDLKEQILPNGMIWVSWPKRASKVPHRRYRRRYPRAGPGPRAGGCQSLCG